MLVKDLIGEAFIGRRKCFISYFAGDREVVERFVERFDGHFIRRSIGVSDDDAFINSDDSNYVMAQIRERFLVDTSITICMLGKCTHSRRYVDWEIKSSLVQGQWEPNGLLGIRLRPDALLPPRFEENWDPSEKKGYAILRDYPASADQLKGWIELAHERRNTHRQYISNPNEMMKYNRQCEVCRETH